MNQEQKKRLKALEGRWCDQKLLDELYGIHLPDEALIGRFRSWAARFRQNKTVAKRNHAYDRHALEGYFQFNKLLPLKWAAARLGMEQESFENLLNVLGEQSLIMRDVTDQTVHEIVVRDIHKFFPALSYKVFSDHNDFCRNLHKAVREESLGLEIKPVRCVASGAFGEDPPDYAYDFDCISSEPVGLRRQVWLDFGKPVNLKPDVCSEKLFLDEYEILSPFLLAGQEVEAVQQQATANHKSAPLLCNR